MDAVAGDPSVVAVGEAHAQAGAKVPSAARRFTDALLPLLAGRASDLVVELMLPPAGCADAAGEVRKKQEVVTKRQAPGDQDEYVAMGERARALGIVPDLLRPSCADLDAVRAAGDDAVDASLLLIKRLVLAKVEELVDRDRRTPADAKKMVVVYGGALHNDPTPPVERAAWSFGPELDRYTQGRYVAVELYVPEYIVDSPAWTSLAFYAHYDRSRLGATTVLFRPGERSYVVLFPLTPLRASSPPRGDAR